jgi:diphosphomevalonate decarboxylase
MTRPFTAVAHANIAFAKYWGKASVSLNTPAASSVGVALAALNSRASVKAIDGPDDVFYLDGTLQTGSPLKRTREFLEIVRARAGITQKFEVVAANDFPTAAGLASSASGFAALATAAAAAAGLDLPEAQLSGLARRGSGSAARSVPAGYCYFDAHAEDPHARTIAGPSDLNLSFAIVEVEAPAKDVPSRDGMELCRETSDFHSAWVARADEDATAIADAVQRGDLEALGELSEANALAMHADGFAARPPLIYFSGATLDTLHLVRRLRKGGAGVWFTCDAGPHPLIFFEKGAKDTVVAALKAAPFIRNVTTSEAGGGAHLV